MKAASKAAAKRAIDAVPMAKWAAEHRIAPGDRSRAACREVIIRFEIERVGGEAESFVVVEKWASAYAAIYRVDALGRAGFDDVDMMAGRRLVAFWNAWNGWVTPTDQAMGQEPADVASFGGGPVVKDRQAVGA